jgi:hypothetical protein
MLIIEEEEFLDKKKLKINRRKNNKTNICLLDTHRRYNDYINKIKYRCNGEYKDIPHYVITKLGRVINIFDSDYSSNTFNNKEIDNKLIKIAIENLGWLNKNTITGIYTNWIGDIYRGEPYIKNWRNKFYWDKYTSVQTENLENLCSMLCDKHNISKNFISSNGFLNYETINIFDGILCKSNFSNIYTDINHSFDFVGFLKQNTNG